MCAKSGTALAMLRWWDGWSSNVSSEFVVVFLSEIFNNDKVLVLVSTSLLQVL